MHQMKKNKKNKKKNPQGSVLVFSLMIMMIMLTVSLGIAAVSLIDQKATLSTSKSQVAFQSADSGFEEVLKKIKKDGYSTVEKLTNIGLGGMTCDDSSGVAVVSGVEGDSAFELIFRNHSGVEIDSCLSMETISTVKSIGTYSGTSRAIESEVDQLRGISISMGSGRTCIVALNGNMYCQGADETEQSTGIVYPVASFGYTGGNAIGGASTSYHSCAVTFPGDVVCAGIPSEGPTSVDIGRIMSYAGTDARGAATAVTVGHYHTCALTDLGNVVCEGASCNLYDCDHGQAADYDGSAAKAIAVDAAAFHTCIVLENGSVLCNGGGDGFDYGQVINYLGGDAIDVSVSNYSTCILKNTGDVECFGGGGGNDYGQIITYDAVAESLRAMQISTGEWQTCILKEDKNVKCWGNPPLGNDYGQVIDYNGGDATFVWTEKYHTCIIKGEGDVECWGNNNSGQSEPWP